MLRRIVMMAVASVAQPAFARPQEPQARPELLGKLVDCRKIATITERVACYDRHVSALDEAERKRDVVLVDRTEMRKARRSLFGLTMPKLKIFGDDDRSEPEFSQIQASISNARMSGGKWLFELDDGTVWTQSDSEDLARSPRPGNAIRIRRAAMGSYFANVEKAPAIRVRRVN